MVLLQGTIAPATPESGQGGNPCQGDLDSLAVFRKMASGTSFGSGRMSQGQEKRQRVWEKICPSSGPGKLSASERERKAKEFIAASGVDTEGYFNNVVKQTNQSGVTFRGQAETWLESMRNRDSEPLAPSTLAPWSYALDKWINPNIGDMPLASVKNTAMKDLVAKMKAGLPPKSVINYAQIVKMVVASAINEEGEQLYPQKWNHKFIGMPVVNKKKQNTPSFTGEVLTAVLVATEEKKYRVLFALCASTGLRFGEALGIDIKNISPTAPQSRLSRKHGVRHPVLKKLAQPKLAMASVIAVHTWRILPFAVVIFLAGLSSIPKEVDDAAAIDGATGFRKFWSVSLPLQLPIATVALLFGIVFTATDMAVVYILTNGGPPPSNATEMVTTWAYKTGIESGSLGAGAAISLFLLPVLAVVAIGMLIFARRAEVT